MKKLTKKKVGIIAICLVIIGAGGYLLKSKLGSSKTTTVAADSVATQMQKLVATATKSELKDTLSATGVVALNLENDVFAGSKNNVLTLPVAVGDKVKKGDILLTYDVKDEQNTLQETIDQTTISLANAKLALANITAPISETKSLSLNNAIISAQKEIDSANVSYTSAKSALADATASVENQKVVVNTAKTAMDNYKVLLDAGSASKSDYDSKVTTYTNAVSSLDTLNRNLTSKQQAVDTANNNIKYAKNDLYTAQKQLEIAKSPLSDSTTKNNYDQSVNNIQLLQLKLDDAKKALKDEVTQIVSPYDGTIEKINSVVGNNQQVGATAMIITDYTDLIVTSNISEYDVSKLSVGQDVSMYSDKDTTKFYQGKIIDIGNTASTISVNNGKQNVIEIKVSLTSDDRVDLKAGFGLNLDIVNYDVKDALVVPTTAVQTENGKKYVYLLTKDRTIAKTEITIGKTNDTEVEVLTGLQENDRVIKEITDKLKDGASISTLITVPSSKSSSGMSPFRMGSGRPPSNSGGGNYNGGGNNTNKSASANVSKNTSKSAGTSKKGN